MWKKRLVQFKTRTPGISHSDQNHSYNHPFYHTFAHSSHCIRCPFSLPIYTGAGSTWSTWKFGAPILSHRESTTPHEPSWLRLTPSQRDWRWLLVMNKSLIIIIFCLFPLCNWLLMVDVVGDESSPLLFYWGSGRSGGLVKSETRILILIFILPTQFPFRMLSSFCSWTLRSSALSFLRIRMPQELLWRRISSICFTKCTSYKGDFQMHRSTTPSPRVILGFLGLVFGNPHPSADAPCHPSWPGTFACPSHRRHRICRTDRSICLSICLPIDPPSRHQNGVLPQSSSIFTMFYHVLPFFMGIRRL